MYISPDEDRSDLFLAAAVYVIGPQVLAIILGRLPVSFAVSPVVALAAIVLTTVAVPAWLIRYRKQRLADFGFDRSTAAFGYGLLLSLPVVAAYVLAAAISGNVLGGVPIADALNGLGWVGLFLQVLGGLCLALLLIYVTVKARTAFRADPSYLAPIMLTLGRIVGIAAAVASALLLLTALMENVGLRDSTQILLAPLGVAAAGWLAYRNIRGTQLSSRATLLTPMVLLAIGSFVIFDEAVAVVFGLWRAALLAGVGLIAAVLLESRRTAWAPLGFATGLTLLTPLLR